MLKGDISVLTVNIFTIGSWFIYGYTIKFVFLSNPTQKHVMPPAFNIEHYFVLAGIFIEWSIFLFRGLVISTLSSLYFVFYHVDV